MSKGILVLAVLGRSPWTGETRQDSKLLANPPLSTDGGQEALELAGYLLPRLKMPDTDVGSRIISDRSQRSLGTASILAAEFGLEIETDSNLGITTFYDRGTKKEYRYPTAASGTPLTWQKQGVAALLGLAEATSDRPPVPDGMTVLIVTQREILGSVIAYARGLKEEKHLGHIAFTIDSKELTSRPWWEIRIKDGDLTIEV